MEDWRTNVTFLVEDGRKVEEMDEDSSQPQVQVERVVEVGMPPLCLIEQDQGLPHC